MKYFLKIPRGQARYIIQLKARDKRVKSAFNNDYHSNKIYRIWYCESAPEREIIVYDFASDEIEIILAGIEQSITAVSRS